MQNAYTHICMYMLKGKNYESNSAMLKVKNIDLCMKELFARNMVSRHLFKRLELVKVLSKAPDEHCHFLNPLHSTGQTVVCKLFVVGVLSL